MPHTPLVKKLNHQTYKLFLEQKHPQNFIFQNYKFTSLFSHFAQYSLDHLLTFGTIRTYDPIKQYYILSRYLDPTRPLIVPQEALRPNGAFFTANTHLHSCR